MIKNSLGDTDSVENPSLAEIAHQMKGLLGIFHMVGSAMPANNEIRDIFDEGLKRMQQLSNQIDQHVRHKY